MYCTLVKPLAGLVKNILCDLEYDDDDNDDSLYHFSNKNHLRSITLVKQYLHTPPRENQTRRVYDSKKGQKLYRDRKISIEPLFEIIKDTFDSRAVPVRIVQCKIICVDLRLVYQLAVYYNCTIGIDNPRIVKRMLCCC